jgi:hypothetical protein
MLILWPGLIFISYYSYVCVVYFVNFMNLLGFPQILSAQMCPLTKRNSQTLAQTV